MAETVNFMLGYFYHNQKKKKYHPILESNSIIIDLDWFLSRRI